MVFPYFETDLGILYHADCRDIISSLDMVDLAITSPPYLNQRDYGFKMNWFKVVPYAISSINADQVLVNLGLVHSNGEVITYWDYLIKIMREKKWKFKGWYVWDQLKGMPVRNIGRLSTSHEFIFHFNRCDCELIKTVKCIAAGKKLNHSTLRNKKGNLQYTNNKNKVINDYRVEDSVLRVSREYRNRTSHPAVFPVELTTKLIEAFPCKTVIDPFIGSGTTAISCERIGIKWIGIEKSEKYCEIAAKRIEKESKQKKLFPIIRIEKSKLEQKELAFQ